MEDDAQAVVFADIKRSKATGELQPSGLCRLWEALLREAGFEVRFAPWNAKQVDVDWRGLALAVVALVWVLVASGLHIAGAMPVRLVLVCGCIVGAYSCRPRWLRVLLTVLAIVLLVGSCGVLMPWWPLFNPFV